MPQLIVVKGAIAAISAPGAELMKPTHKISTVTSDTFEVDGKSVVIEADVKLSFATYVTPYTKPGFSVPGTLTFSSLNPMNGLSRVATKDKSPVVLLGSTGQLLVTPAPANSGPPDNKPDLAPPTMLDVKFTSAGQTTARGD